MKEHLQILAKNSIFERGNLYRDGEAQHWYSTDESFNLGLPEYSRINSGLPKRIFPSIIENNVQFKKNVLGIMTAFKHQMSNVKCFVPITA